MFLKYFLMTLESHAEIWKDFKMSFLNMLLHYVNFLHWWEYKYTGTSVVFLLVCAGAIVIQVFRRDLIWMLSPGKSFPYISVVEHIN